jgi:hypothetical protein
MALTDQGRGPFSGVVAAQRLHAGCSAHAGDRQRAGRDAADRLREGLSTGIKSGEFSPDNLSHGRPARPA